ncbi:MAG: alpha,alpha-phosphotrehalase [Clostridium sp.]|jgi:oligo-1,6-glucosidase|nr:alpha,alpha-phosphotrehalase [Clostridium sp.]
MDWQKSCVVYQIYPKSFCDSNGDGVGDICGIITKLDYLKNLGVDVLWISPIFKSPGYDNGYDISDYRAIDPIFGTQKDFERLIKEAHIRGMKLMLDLVVNHSSHEHEWFKQSRSSKDNPYRDFYIWRDGKGNNPPTNWKDLFGGGSCWTFDAKTKQYYLHLFSPQQPDLNWENPTLRGEIYNMMDYWLSIGVDGFRMDVISYISKPCNLPDAKEGESVTEIVANGARVHEYLREMRSRVLDKYDTITVGEAAGVTVDEAKKYAGLDGCELDMVFHFEVNELDGGESCKWNTQKIALSDLKAVYTKWQKALDGVAWNSLYLSNHDQPRSVSRFGDDGDLYRERSQKLLAICTYLMQGTPFIYQGEELGMTFNRFTRPDQLRDIESLNAYRSLTARGVTQDDAMDIISKRGRDSARTPMQWSAKSGAGFTTGEPWLMINKNHAQINAEEQLSRPDSVYNFYKKLIAFRKANGVFVTGKYIPIFEERDDILAYLRRDKNQCVMVIGNYTDKPVFIEHLDENFKIKNCLLGNIEHSDFLRSATLQAYEAVVLRACRVPDNQ